jgi:hypothetical protein
VEAEGGDHEVEVAVAVEVGRLEVHRARQPLGKDVLVEPAGCGLSQPHDRALLVVLGQEVADIGDQQVQPAVLVEVHDRGVGGVRDLRDLA